MSKETKEEIKIVYVSEWSVVMEGNYSSSYYSNYVPSKKEDEKPEVPLPPLGERDFRLYAKRGKDYSKTMSSKIVDISGRVITTESGTICVLGEVDPLFTAWARRNDLVLDEKFPFSDAVMAKLHTYKVYGYYNYTSYSNRREFNGSYSHGRYFGVD